VKENYHVIDGTIMTLLVLWRIIMTSWRCKLFAMLLGLVAISALAGPLGAAPGHHHKHRHPHFQVR
jgi:hypothetical protein